MVLTTWWEDYQTSKSEFIKIDEYNYLKIKLFNKKLIYTGFVLSRNYNVKVGCSA